MQTSKDFGSVILKLKKFPVEVIVVDDGSTDETASIVKWREWI